VGADPPAHRTGRSYGIPELFQYRREETLAAESLLLGRPTYEWFTSACPARSGEFADKGERDARACGVEP
jgi:hypothetical protein